MSPGRASPLLRQIWIAGTVHMVMMGLGMAIGFPSVLLPALEAPESTIKISLETSSWLVACLAVSCLIGYSISPFLINSYGRRTSMIILLFPAILGYAITYFARDISHLMAGRFFIGLSAGPTGVLGAVIIGEYTSPEYRGVLLNLKTAAFFSGCTLVHVFGQLTHWRTTCIICSLPVFLSIAMALTWPESPYHLISKRNYDECVKSFYWLRGKSEKSIRELHDLISAQKEKPWTQEKSFSQEFMELVKKFKRKDFLKPVFVYVFAAILLETNGRHIFPSYALQIVTQMTGDKSQTFFYTLCIDLIITGSSLLSSILIKIMRRRTLLFSTGVLSIITLLSVCLFLYLRSTGMVSKDYNVMALVLISFYFILVNLGCAPIPLTLVGELFPLEHRAAGACIAGLLVSSILFLLLKVLPLMLLTLDIYGTFAVLSVFMTVSLAALYNLLPETKNKTLQEIEDYFKYGTLNFNKRNISEENCTYLVDHDKVVIT